MLSDMAKEYRHFVNPVKEITNWPDRFTGKFITSMDELKALFVDFKPGETTLAFDLETSGLDPENSFIVGVALCLSYDSSVGYYVAINHCDDEFNLYDEGLDFIYSRLSEARLIFVYNAKFEIRFMEYHGYDKHNYDYKKKRLGFIKYDMSKVSYYDVSIGIHYADTNESMPSLKWASLHFLGFRQESFLEVLDDAVNFHYVDPKGAVLYGASDAYCTYWLAHNTIKYYREGGRSGVIDNKLLYPLVHFENERIFLDGDYLESLARVAEIESDKLEKKVFDIAGNYYNLNSPPQVSEMFSRMGIDTGKRTKTGFMATGKDVLDSLPDHVREEHPLLDYYINFKQTTKILSSYIKPLIEEFGKKGFLRCNYMTQRVPTGRLASGKDAKNTFFSSYNIQSTPKPNPAYFHVFRSGDNDLFDREKNILMGYRFVQKGEEDPSHEEHEEYIGVAEGSDTYFNVRKAFLPHFSDSGDDMGEWVWCSIDYATQELRIPSNLSREPVWVNAFVGGRDIHKETAIRLMGEEHYDKDARKKAKGCSSLKSFILTERGLVKAGKLRRDDKVISIDGRSQSYKYEIENRDCMVFSLSNGIADVVTTDHLYAVYNDAGKLSWKRADNIVVGDRLTVGQSRKQFSSEYHSFNNLVLDEDLAYVLALGSIDGCFHIDDNIEGWSVTLRNKEKVFKVKGILSKYGNVVRKDYDDYTILTLYSNTFAQFIKDKFFIIEGAVVQKGVHDLIFTSPKSVMTSFVEGCLDSSGAGGHSIQSFNPDVLADVAVLLSCLGIEAVRSGVHTLKLETYGNVEGFGTKVISIGKTQEPVFVMETEHHTYLSNMVESHNCNFGVLYGMTARSLASRFKMSLAEGEDFHRKYKRALPVLFGWAKRVCTKAQKVGTVYNYFSRPRRLRYYFEKNPGFGNRTAVNTIVQGTASDILKISLIKLWKSLLNADEYKDRVRFLTTVHDEVDFAIHKSNIKEISVKCMEDMNFRLKEWPVTISVGISFGWSWGENFDFEYDESSNMFSPILE